MIAIQLVISIIYIGSWVTFCLVKIPRIFWGLIFAKWRLKILNSPRSRCIMMADWILRLVTLLIYVGIAFGFSIELPKQFCNLIGIKEDPAFTSCKWQVFGFRIVFILLSLPIELLMLAVVYRHATDMIFKAELREVTGVSDFE